LEEGVGFFRLRRRGPAVEAVVCDTLVPGGDPGALRELLRRLARVATADHTVALGRSRFRAGYVRLPRVGPVLTWRGVSIHDPPPLPSWQLSLGDIELL
jgi:hypothetical protein